MSFADKVSLLRILLIPVFVSLLFYYNGQHLYLKYAIVAVFTLAVLTDFFDGFVARLKKEKSKIGEVIDPLADKLLLLTAFICLYGLRKSLPFQETNSIPLYVVLIVVSRDLIILLGVLILYLLKIEIPIAPSVWGKLTTFFQMLTVLFVLIDIPLITPYIWMAAVAFTLISGVGYFTRGVRAINVKTNPARH
ncbi:MAG: CDP-alcohol phosphatidyltransferase family protein [Candidatus Omnitrophica bacterium]|nr:CDP-alcohol phosphatidyltransferase family protein [Candidatus Omnitrophota bacterium]